MRKLRYDYKPEIDWIRELKYLVISIFIGTMIFCIFATYFMDELIMIFR
jgi:hypothetical protein